MIIGRPHESEYPPHYGRYVDLVPEADIFAAMAQQMDQTIVCLTEIPEALADHCYERGKWTIREVVGHILDTERIYGFRLLTFARGDTVALSRADQELYVTHGDFRRFGLREWVDEFAQVRRAHVTLVRHLPAEAWARTGTVSGAVISVRALAYLMVGHERHHVDIIQGKYLRSARPA
jgi:uncharacterized damage-inducible protein DinB